jgi:outer membrane murein-binding lipoprotein Lpp
MAKRRVVTAIVAVVLGSLTLTGAALADERQPQRSPRDHRAFCERLEETAQELRAKIGHIQAVQERIRQKIASGELTPEQEARAKQALRKLEALQEELEERLERLLEIYGEKCQR